MVVAKADAFPTFHRRSRRHGVAPPEHGFNPGREFSGQERFGQVVIGSLFEADDPIHPIGPRSEHHHGKIIPGIPQPAQSRQTIIAGQHQVKNHKIWPLAFQTCLELLHIAEAAHVIALVDQVGADHLSQFRVVVHHPDLVVLDLMLPGDDGLTALRRLRDAGDDLPVVMLTARADGVDRIIGLEQGADDYLAKPFLPRELTARIEAVLRRRNAMPAGTPVEGGECIRFGDNQLDLSARTLLQNNEPVVITSGEFSLLAAFVRHPHRPLSRERLIELARGPGSDTDSRSMDVQVSRVRKLVEPDPTRPRYVQTVWGYGYVFVPDGTPRSR